MIPRVDTCPVCGATYDDFRTGETFAGIKRSLWVESENPEHWRHKRRNTVLGHWHGLKLQMWESHLALCKAALNSPPPPDVGREAFAEY